MDQIRYIQAVQTTENTSRITQLDNWSAAAEQAVGSLGKEVEATRQQVQQKSGQARQDLAQELLAFERRQQEALKATGGKVALVDCNRVRGGFRDQLVIQCLYLENNQVKIYNSYNHISYL